MLLNNWQQNIFYWFFKSIFYDLNHNLIKYTLDFLYNVKHLNNIKHWYIS